jgi:glycine oxidase
VNTYDVVIVGGGIIGGSIAFELAQRNLHVIVLDRQELMREASWAAAGMLSAAPDSPAAIPLVPLGRASLALYSRFIDAIEESSVFGTGYRTGGALEVLCHGDAERELSTLVALHHGLGLPCEPLPLEEAREMEPALGREARAAAFLPDEASVNPRALTSALLASCKLAGAELRPGTEVISLIKDKKRCTGVKTSAGEIFSASHVVVAAGCWTSQLSGVVL